MREFRPYGSVRGALSNERPYRDPKNSPLMTFVEQLDERHGSRLVHVLKNGYLDAFGAQLIEGTIDG